MMKLTCFLLLVTLSTASHFAGFSLEWDQSADTLTAYSTAVWSCAAQHFIIATPGADHSFATVASFGLWDGPTQQSCQDIAGATIKMVSDNFDVENNDEAIPQNVVAFGESWAQLEKRTVQPAANTVSVKIDHMGSARISGLKDNNGDSGWNIHAGTGGDPAYSHSPFFYNPGRLFLEVGEEFVYEAPAWANYELYMAVVGDRSGLTTAMPDGMEFDGTSIRWTPTAVGTYVVQFAVVAKDEFEVQTGWEVQLQVVDSLIAPPTLSYDEASGIITATKQCEISSNPAMNSTTACQVFHSANDGVVTPLDGFCMLDDGYCQRRFQFNAPAGVTDFRAVPGFYAMRSQGFPTTALSPGSLKWSGPATLQIDIGNPQNPFVDPERPVNGFLVIKNCMGCDTDCGAPHRGICDEDQCVCVCRQPFVSADDLDDCSQINPDCRD